MSSKWYLRAGKWVYLPKQISRRKEARDSQPEEALWTGRHKVSDARRGRVNESRRNVLRQPRDKGRKEPQ